MPTALNKSLIESIRSKDLERTRALLDEGADPNALSETGKSALVLAVDAHSPDLVTLLLQRGADANFHGDSRSPLFRARIEEQPEIARMLVERGAALDVFDAACIGDMPRLNALLKEHPEAVHWRDKGEQTPLFCAYHLQAAKTLIALGADVNARDDIGWRPLNVACSWADADVVDALLDAGADVNAQDNIGWTALHEVAQLGSVERVTHLMERGAKIDLLTEYGATPLYEAIDYGHCEVVDLLLSHGADMELLDYEGENAWDIAAGNEAMLQILQKHQRMRQAR